VFRRKTEEILKSFAANCVKVIVVVAIFWRKISVSREQKFKFCWGEKPQEPFKDLSNDEKLLKGEKYEKKKLAGKLFNDFPFANQLERIFCFSLETFSFNQTATKKNKKFSRNLPFLIRLGQSMSIVMGNNSNNTAPDCPLISSPPLKDN
jgi:hypothetical protein